MVLRIPFGEKVFKTLYEDQARKKPEWFAESLAEYVYYYLVENFGEEMTDLMWIEGRVYWQVRAEIVPMLLKLARQGGEIPEELVIRVRKRFKKSVGDVDNISSKSKVKEERIMKKERSGWSLIEQEEGIVEEPQADWKEVIEILAGLMKDAVDTIVQAVSNLEDIAELGKEDEVVRGYKRQIAGALDILVSGLEELLDIFDYKADSEEEEEEFELFDDKEKEIGGEEESEVEGEEEFVAKENFRRKKGIKFIK